MSFRCLHARAEVGAKDRIHRFGAIGVCVLGQHAPARPLSDFLGAAARQTSHQGSHILAIARNENLLVGLKEQVDALPVIGNEAGAGAGRLEDPRRGRKSGLRHAGTRYVENRHGSDVEGVVVARRHVADVVDIRRHRLVLPAGATEQEFPVPQTRGRLQEEALDPGLPVRQAIAEETEIGAKAAVLRYRMMSLRVERIVDRNAFGCPDGAVCTHDRIAAAIGQHKIDLGERSAQRVIGIGPEFGKRCRGIDVPEDFQGSRSRVAKDFLQQQIVFETDAARLDDNIGPCSFAGNGLQCVDRSLVDDDPAPVRWIDVAVFLPIVDVGLVEGDLIAFPRERPQQAAIVSGGTIPIGRDEARTIKCDFHSAASHG
ncbi:hypothetical protein RHECNPAF_2190032 [Rhizobium etli CNPAF512]|nr:hypothetical protein RHECNPAF_2190032 [Rhizobium etli CNPAF512]